MSSVPGGKRPLILLATLTGVFGLWLCAENWALRTTTAPWGMYELELARTPQRAAEVIAGWKPVQAEFPEHNAQLSDMVRGVSSAKTLAAERMQLLGYGFLMLWGLTLGIACWRLESLSGVLAVALAALADAVENTVLLGMLQGNVELAAAAFWLALAKFGLLFRILGWMSWELWKRRKPRLAAAAFASLIILAFPAVAILLRRGTV